LMSTNALRGTAICIPATPIRQCQLFMTFSTAYLSRSAGLPRVPCLLRCAISCDGQIATTAQRSRSGELNATFPVAYCLRSVARAMRQMVAGEAAFPARAASTPPPQIACPNAGITSCLCLLLSTSVAPLRGLVRDRAGRE
jgi:hypothetical protein